MGIHYLDVDDEVTGAVARLRASTEPHVALVLPAGSRVATSRINFRLLAREAAARSRRLSIVAPETAVRAIAIAAGLPAYATVAAYEDALADEAAQERRERAAGNIGSGISTTLGQGRGPAPAGRGAGAAPLGAASGAAGTAGASPAPASASGAGSETRAGAAAADDARAPSGSAIRGGGAARGGAGDDGSATALMPAAGGAAAVPAGRSAGALPTVRGHLEERPRRRRRWLVPLLALVLVLVVAGGAGAYFVLPAATITITPVGRAAGPVTLQVTADPAATAVDPAKLVIPAQQVSVPLTVQQTFPATGKKVELTAAKGSVTFASNNPLDPVTIGAGTTVATASGVQFQTTATVVAPKATISGQTITAGTVNAPITAVNEGTAGNVPAHAISVVPQRLQNFLVSVDNAAPTSGGTRTEQKVVSQSDYDGAVKALAGKLDQQLTAALAQPSTAPSGTEVVKGTEQRGDPQYAPAADALVGAVRGSFELTATASGSVIAVSQAPLASLASDRLRADVTQGWSLFEDSVRTQVSDPSVESGRVVFTVTAQGEQWQAIDGAALLAQVKGKPVDEARQMLAPYGDVTIQTWPSYVTSIPTLDARVQLTVAPPKRMGT